MPPERAIASTDENNCFGSAYRGGVAPLAGHYRWLSLQGGRRNDTSIVKEILHNMGGSLTDDFQPSVACKTLDYPPGNLLFLQATPDKNSPRHTNTQ